MNVSQQTAMETVQRRLVYFLMVNHFLVPIHQFSEIWTLICLDRGFILVMFSSINHPEVAVECR